MPLIKHINRIEQLDQLIRLKKTGPSRQLAHKLDISERWLYKLLGELREELDCPITYNRCRQSYEYEKPGKLILGFQKEIGDRRISFPRSLSAYRRERGSFVGFLLVFNLL